jgi:hypothetical protein
MTKTLRLLLVIVGILLFAVGLLLGQQIRRAKFEKYLNAATVTPMEVAVLRTNVEIVKQYMPIAIGIPTVYYNPSCACFTAHAIITSESMKKPLDEVRSELTAKASLVRKTLEDEFPEFSKPGTVPDRDFKMTFFELNLQKPDASHDLAEYVDGKIVFK